jgi:hypothetical protein
VGLNIPEKKDKFNTEGFMGFLIAICIFGSMFAAFAVFILEPS